MKLGLNTVQEACTILGVGESTLYGYIRKGWLTKRKINTKQNGFDPEDLKKFLATMQKGEFKKSTRDGNLG